MKFIEPEVHVLCQEHTVSGALKMSEYAARTCYASTDKMDWKGGEDKTRTFIDGLIKSGHGEPLECNAIYLKWDMVKEDYDHNRYTRYLMNEYSRVRTYEGDTNCYVTTNYRVLVDNGWYDNDCIYICEPVEGKHEPRISVLFKTQIVIASEINRYRKNSKGQRSSRYCNFSKEKFGNEINISMPVDEDITKENIDEAHERYKREDVAGTLFEEFMGNSLLESVHPIDYWMFANSICEFCYMKLTSRFGWKAQRARRILPLDTHTEMVHTAYLSDWKHFLAQRADETTGPVHPDLKIIADSLKRQFIDLGYIKEGEILK